MEAIFRHHSFGSNCGKLQTGIVAYAVILQLGGRTGRLIKSSFIAYNELKGCQLIETIVLPKCSDLECHADKRVIIFY
jgi:hypothetical protein